MANKKYIHGSELRIYKNGEYLGTLTSASLNATQNTIDRQYIGDYDTTTIATNKSYEGTLDRDMFDESFVELVIGNQVTSLSTVSNYTLDPDTVKATVNSGSDEDISFTTPNVTGLTVQAVVFNAVKVGSFAGGLDIEIWEGLAGSGTLKATFSCEAGELPVLDNEFLTTTLDEADEVALTANTAHTIRFTPAGAPTGDVNLYGNSTETEPYFAIQYEMATTEPADYTIDIVLPLADGSETIFRATNITFTSNGINMSSGELITEAMAFKAKNVTVL